MKYLILIASVALTSTYSASASEYQTMLTNITKAAKGHPSITLFNNSQHWLYMEVGDLEKDNKKSRIIVRKDTHFTLSPYAHPFFLNKELMHEGTIIKFFDKHPEEKRENTQSLFLHIGGNSEIQFGSTVHINYDTERFTAHNIPNNPEPTSPKKPQKTLKLIKLQPHRANTIS